MLTEHEEHQVTQAIAATAEILGQEIKPTATAIMVEDLAHYPFAVIMGALKRLRVTMDGRLSVKAIVDVIEEGSGRLTANEAWALALGALDEATTIVWTDEIAAAWSVARPIMDLGDKVGARMAFIPAYERSVKDAREQGRLPKWSVSLGWDQEQRKQAVEQAMTAGRLTSTVATALLPPPEAPIDEEGRAKVQGLLRKLAEDLRSNSEASERRRVEDLERQRRDFEARKERVLQEARDAEQALDR